MTHVCILTKKPYTFQNSIIHDNSCKPYLHDKHSTPSHPNKPNHRKHHPRLIQPTILPIQTVPNNPCLNPHTLPPSLPHARNPFRNLQSLLTQNAIPRSSPSDLTAHGSRRTDKSARTESTKKLDREPETRRRRRRRSTGAGASRDGSSGPGTRGLRECGTQTDGDVKLQPGAGGAELARASRQGPQSSGLLAARAPCFFGM